MGMTELQRYRQMLEDKYEDLRWAIRKREAIAVERSANVIDELQPAVERERAITELDRYSRMLQQGKAALSRIQEGAFGFCLRCDEPISPARLKACLGPPSASGVRRLSTPKAGRTERRCWTTSCVPHSGFRCGD